MPFTVRDFESLLRALDKRAEWRAQLRRLLLTDDLLSLPEIVRRLAGHLEQLAAAQQRTESRLEQLADAQRRTEDQVARLVEEMRRLADSQRETARQVGALAEAVGFTLEDLAREVAPAYLEKHYGIRVAELQRRFLTLDTEEVEVDLYGEGTRDGERVVVVGEVKSRIYGRDVEALGRRVQALASALPGILVPVLFGFAIHPSAIDAAARAGAVVISSSGATGARG